MVFFDMSGNVFEWCHDLYDKSLPKPLPKNYKGATQGKNRVVRGGNWQREINQAKVFYRNAVIPLFHQVNAFI